MSANNFILIKRVKDGFRVDECDTESRKVNVKIGKVNTLEEAIKLAQEYAKDEIIEYGINFSI